ncbi:UDP-N-acetylglucosamine 1-carboxyvinyltransferase [Acetobacteraceae bacterium]|nr:UDP-N-acetylglucosamine 1-carboxyvinyltransferase [Acetobacteraceae bacterium]
MDKFIIEGGQRLEGIIPISGAKNSALKLMAASLLVKDETIILKNVPAIADVLLMARLLEHLGLRVKREGHVLEISGRADKINAPYDIVTKMRASVLVLGPLLARYGEASVSLPGGCAIGTRPVDLHLKALEALGAEISLESGDIHAKAPKGLKGAVHRLDFPSVGATENMMMAAALAEGETEIHNAACEPEIADLAGFINTLGGRISGAGTSIIKIEGVKTLHGTTYAVVSDRIEAGTYAVASAITGGDILLEGALASNMEKILDALETSGATVSLDEKGIRVRGSKVIKPQDIRTEPYPGFPTDMQAQLTALLAVAEGTSSITETIFENRFMHVQELIRMGADITLNGRVALIKGVKTLQGARVMATDLRASFSLILAGLRAEGVTELRRVYHLDRGYEGVEEKLSACGAKISRVKDQ